jgi:hypothetical protein
MEFASCRGLEQKSQIVFNFLYVKDKNNKRMAAIKKYTSIKYKTWE